MTRHIRITLAVLSCCGVSIGVAACGGGGAGDVPGDSVAKVADTSIKASKFNHWMRIAAIASATPPDAKVTGKTPGVMVPDQPEFKQCIAAVRSGVVLNTNRPNPPGTPPKEQCAQQYELLKSRVVDYLVRNQWLEAEVARQKITITKQDVQRQFQQITKLDFPKPSDFVKYLRQAGMTKADFLFRQRVQVLQTKVSQKVAEGAGNITQAEIAAYYAKNKQRLGRQETRNAQLIFTETEGKSAQALAQLKSGTPFAAVYKKVSVDPLSKARSGTLVGAQPNQDGRPYNDAMFSAKLGAVVGPIKTKLGFYVLRVIKITPGKPPSLREATPTIKQLVRSQRQQDALTKFGNAYQTRWKAQTTCRSGFLVQACKNYKAPKRPAKPTPGVQTAPGQQQAATGTQ